MEKDKKTLMLSGGFRVEVSLKEGDVVLEVFDENERKVDHRKFTHHDLTGTPKYERDKPMETQEFDGRKKWF